MDHVIVLAYQSEASRGQKVLSFLRSVEVRISDPELAALPCWKDVGSSVYLCSTPDDYLGSIRMCSPKLLLKRIRELPTSTPERLMLKLLLLGVWTLECSGLSDQRLAFLVED